MKYSITIIVFLACSLFHSYSQRLVLNLNGTWEIEESIDAYKQPKKYTHTVQVPGLANQSIPAFQDVDRFYGKEYYSNYWVQPSLVKLDINADTMKIGYSFQKRNYFWYKRVFEIKEIKEIYLLKIGKAQFGTEVWVNGKKAGTSQSCFTAQYYNITTLIKVSEKNEVVIRIGAHPGALPPSVPAGNDYEKRHWTPGIYDDVSLICSNYPFIESVQVAPNINTGEILVQSILLGKPGKKIEIQYTVNEWKSKIQIAQSKQLQEHVDDSKPLIINQKIKIPDAKLWSPENPFLYTMEISTGSDNVTTRFGMREFRFDTPTKRAYLNNKIYFLRGSNITLHRFFDDSLCKNHPWDEKWVRKLLADLPQKYNWNSFRFCIGPVPDKWFDIADEQGLLIQNEYFIWNYRPYWDENLLKNHLKDWMRDGWNHPSVAWWDINNETHSDKLTPIIPELRSLDLSNRAWDNGYNLPVGDDDPVEDHNYKWYSKWSAAPAWSVQKFMEGTSEKTTNSPHPTAHACVLNEYGWLWLKRNGEKTLLTAPIYDSIAIGYSNAQRQELYAYLLATETEYFRAHRNYAGIMHFDYLTGDFNGAITGDIFANPETLEPVAVYDEYFSEIFKPLGVYVNYFPLEVKAGTEVNIAVMLVNDEYQQVEGQVKVFLHQKNVQEKEVSIEKFSVGALGQTTIKMLVKFNNSGNFYMDTYAIQANGEKTRCRRKIKVVD